MIIIKIWYFERKNIFIMVGYKIISLVEFNTTYITCYIENYLYNKYILYQDFNYKIHKGPSQVREVIAYFL